MYLVKYIVPYDVQYHSLQERIKIKIYNAKEIAMVHQYTDRYEPCSISAPVVSFALSFDTGPYYDVTHWDMKEYMSGIDF